MRLLAESQRVAAASGIRIVKLLGDGVMLHGDDPGRLVEATLELVDSIAAAGLPQGHAGVHAGPLIERDGDYFGHTVNVASPDRKRGGAWCSHRERRGGTTAT